MRNQSVCLSVLQSDFAPKKSFSHGTPDPGPAPWDAANVTLRRLEVCCSPVPARLFVLLVTHTSCSVYLRRSSDQTRWLLLQSSGAPFLEETPSGRYQSHRETRDGRSAPCGALRPKDPPDGWRSLVVSPGENRPHVRANPYRDAPLVFTYEFLFAQLPN